MTSSPASESITVADIKAAAKRLRGVAVRTPLLAAEAIDRETGGRVLVKAEMLQRTGSFKLRGAYNRVAALDPSLRSRGVVAYSSGNHAQGVAAAAGMLGVPATIVMPSDAPAAKLDGTRALGAEVILYDRDTGDREAIASEVASDRRATLIPPFDDPHVIAGQGTVGLEIADQADDLGIKLDAVLVPCSGGGLSAGTATVLSKRFPEAEVYAVEPEGFDDTARSLAAGTVVGNAPGRTSICDGLLLPVPGTLTLPINRALLAGGLVVDDDAAAQAMAVALRHLKVVAEPSGAVALAAALSGQFDCRGKTVCVICSGGNVDGRTFFDLVRPYI